MFEFALTELVKILNVGLVCVCILVEVLIKTFKSNLKFMKLCWSTKLKLIAEIFGLHLVEMANTCFLH